MVCSNQRRPNVPVRRQFVSILLLLWCASIASAQDSATGKTNAEVAGPTTEVPDQVPITLDEAGVRSCDEIWEANTRLLPDCIPATCDFEFRVYRLSNCQWLQSDKPTLLGSCAETPLRTIVYVHGNWMPLCDARRRALAVYRQLVKCNPEPIRMIAFSWPSEKRDRFAKDVIGKKHLLEASAFYIATLVTQLPNRADVAFMGYSFGGSIVCGALHLLGGGCLQGRVLCESPPQFDHCFRVSLIAPAFDRTSLSNSGQYKSALSVTSQMVNLYNSSDPILRRFRFFDRSNPVAAGFAGLSEPRALEPLLSDVKISQYDCRAIGRTHSELDYHRCSTFSLSVANVLDN